jgi:hypothetical protein
VAARRHLRRDLAVLVRLERLDRQLVRVEAAWLPPGATDGGRA